jgi:hypothetical protein
MGEGDETPFDAEEDPDYISEDGALAPSDAALHPGSSGPWGTHAPVFVPHESTPLDNEGESVLPRYALWSMKYLRGSHLFSHADTDVRGVFGEGDAAVYIIDDGRKHCLISRKVGTGTDGSTYCLVAQIPYSAYDQLLDGADPERIFAGANSFSLCFVYDDEQAVSNVSVVESYPTGAEVPGEYLPPHPPIVFADNGEA